MLGQLLFLRCPVKGLRSCFVLNPLSLQLLRPLLNPPISCSASKVGAEAFSADLQSLLRPGYTSID